MTAGSEVEKKLRGALTQAFQSLTGERAAFLEGAGALGRILSDMLLDTPPCGFLENAHAVCAQICKVGERKGLLEVLGYLEGASPDDHTLTEKLDSALSRAWVDLMARYESHQFRLVGALWRYLQEEEIRPWLSRAADSELARVRMAASCQREYPSDDMECQLRFQAVVWFLVAALKSTLASQEREGWHNLQLAFLIAEAFRRSHLVQSAGAANEIAEATAENKESDRALWSAFKRRHDVWFARWWTMFGPLHAWLNQEMDMCPSRLEKVFRVVGDDAWDLSLVELLEKAERLLS